jgi:hypothetical protein
VDETIKEVATAGLTAATGNPLRPWIFACAVVAFGLVAERSTAGHREHEEREIWFVHATDPHLFVPDPGLQVKEDNDAAATEHEPNEKACLEREGKKRERDSLAAAKQEELNEKALSEMLKSIGSLRDDTPEFLVLTGDLGVDPCDIPDSQNQLKTPAAPTALGTPQPQTQVSNDDKSKKEDKPSAKDCVNGVSEAKRKKQVEKTARVLRESPVKKIYLVAGNNDIAKESASDEAIKYFNLIDKEVQAELVKSKSSVQLHNLTRCYASNEDPATCYADIDKTPYRLIGFPSYSFKNEIKNSPDTAAQAEHFKKFRQLLDAARDAKRKVLIISHTPEIDDPFVLSQDSQAGITPPEAIDKDTTNPRSKWSTWNVNKDLLNGWKDAVALESVVAVFAGHLHDSHKEIYRQPYEWSTMTEHRGAFNKLFLAPPLAVKKQDTSPVQARGFSLVHLRPDRVESRPFWYNSGTYQFVPDKHKHHEKRGGFWGRSCQRLHTGIEWLWNLEKNDAALVRMAVLLIAFLTAFLTVVAIWQIAPASDPFADERKTAPSESKPAQTAANAGADSTPFSNRFGKTVIAGLAGLVAAEVTKTLGNEKPSPDSRWYYIVWFILFFFLLLLSLNLWRAVVEALRARVAVAYYPPPRHAAGTTKTSKLASGEDSSRTTLWSRFSIWFRYWLIMRPGQWLGSLRVPLITFSDTFVNLIQGKNQTRTLVFEKRIIDQQRTVVRVTETIRTSLNRLLERRVQQARAPKPRRGSTKSQSLAHELERVRVNISVLSRDQTNVFYIARAAGSSHSRFPKRSISWASVFTGQPVWFQSDYREPLSDFEKIILFQESPIPDEKGPIRLRDYYQPRPDEDYQSFIILPVPSPRRGFGTDYVKGAIHISFRENEDFASIWNAGDMKPGNPPIYLTPQRTLEDWCRHDDIRAALTTSIAALGELLRGFNEIIYTNYIESRPD